MTIKAISHDRRSNEAQQNDLKAHHSHILSFKKQDREHSYTHTTINSLSHTHHGTHINKSRLYEAKGIFVECVFV